MLDTREKIRRRLTFETSTDDVDAEWSDAEVTAAIRRLLTMREQQVVDKIYSEELSYKEAAESLGVSVATVNKNIVNALRKLRTHFKTVKL